MAETIYLNLLILCGILSQRILGSFLEDNQKNSSNLHCRRKRMVPQTVLGHGDWMFNRIIHTVKIFKDDVQICAGVIITPEHVLTPGACVFGLTTSYRIESGAPDRGPIENHQINYISAHKRLYMLLIGPAISPESRFSRPMQPAGGFLPEGMPPTTIAWDATGHVRSIMEVQIADIDDCTVIYQHHQPPLYVDENSICTEPSYHEHYRCSTRDRGSPLVVGDRFFAVLERSGNYSNGVPDVFILVNNQNTYYSWIMDYIRPYLRNHSHLYNPER